MTDAQLIRASLKKPGLFGLIFERHFEAIYRYLQRRLGSEAAEEVASATFLEAYEHRKRYDPRRSDARPWLFGIASNLLRHHFREERARLAAYARAQSQFESSNREQEGIEDRLDAARMIIRITGVLASLNPDDRDVLLLHAWADFSYREIAETLGIPTGTVRSRLHRVRQVIRELVDLDAAIDV
jgi:RNA polymerase sigma factor (sigma-70 family)